MENIYVSKTQSIWRLLHIFMYGMYYRSFIFRSEFSFLPCFYEYCRHQRLGQSLMVLPVPLSFLSQNARLKLFMRKCEIIPEKPFCIYRNYWTKQNQAIHLIKDQSTVHSCSLGKVMSCISYGKKLTYFQNVIERSTKACLKLTIKIPQHCAKFFGLFVVDSPAGNYLFKFNNRNTRARC